MAQVLLSAQRPAAADRLDGGHQSSANFRQTTPERECGPKTPGPSSTGKSTRRCFTAEYKLWVLHEADQCAKPGDLGALLQREGLYSSHLCAWRRQREAGALAALAPKKRGRKAIKNDGMSRENQLLLRENQHLQARLRQAEMIIAMQAKVSDALGISLTAPDAPDAPATQLASTQTAPRSDQPEHRGGHRGNDTT